MGADAGRRRNAPKATPGGGIAADSLHAAMMAGRVRLETLVSLRWIAIAGQLAALFVVRYGLGFSFPLFWALAAVGLSAAVNGYLMWRHPGGRQLADREAVLELAFDLLQLSFLLYLTGGLANPFALLILAPVTVSASVLSRRSTLALLTLGLLLISLLALWHRPLPWEGTALAIPRLYLFAVWAGLALAMTFLALYVARVSAEARQRAQALAATEAALDRAQKLSDLGALAAAAAHELGTPLGTITLAVRELLEELPADDPRGEDLRLISDQAERCRDILQQLSMRSEQPSGHPFDVQPLSALAREAARPFERLTDVAIEVRDRATDPAAGPQPQTRRRPEILHALTNFIENAVGFARGRVEIDIRWDISEAWCRIRDDGPGFDTAVLRHLGAPYLGADPRGSPSSARESAAGLGLGVFIAKTLLERTGARVEFGNAAEGGAVVSIRWPRSALEDGDKNTEDAS